MRRRVVLRGDGAERGIADLVYDVVLGEAAFGDELDARLVEAALDELAQGYYFGNPMSAAAATSELLRRINAAAV